MKELDGALAQRRPSPDEGTGLRPAHRGPRWGWSRRIERERRVPPGSGTTCARADIFRSRPQAYGGRGIPFARYRADLELFSMSHASIRMIVHVVNGTWRRWIDSRTRSSAEPFVLPSVQADGAFTLTEPTMAGTGADLPLQRCAQGDTYYCRRRKTPRLRSNDLRLLAALSLSWRARIGEPSPCSSTAAARRGATVVEMDESMGVRGTDHARLRFDRTRFRSRIDSTARPGSNRARRFLDAQPHLRLGDCVGLARRAQARDRVRSRKREAIYVERDSSSARPSDSPVRCVDIKAARRCCSTRRTSGKPGEGAGILSCRSFGPWIC